MSRIVRELGQRYYIFYRQRQQFYCIRQCMLRVAVYTTVFNHKYIYKVVQI